MIRADYEKTVLAHYDKKQVQQEIARFSKNRWIAMHCETVNPNGCQVLLRYDRTGSDGKPPLRVAEPEHILALLSQFKHLRPRTFYASICLYRELSKRDDVRDVKNITQCAPTWDIDKTPEKWRATMQAAKSARAQRAQRPRAESGQRNRPAESLHLSPKSSPEPR